jgi:hypothetical protein
LGLSSNHVGGKNVVTGAGKGHGKSSKGSAGKQTAANPLGLSR